MKQLKVTRCKGEGQGSCYLCNKRGIWNRNWMSLLVHIEGYPGNYCSACLEELRHKNKDISVEIAG